MATLGPRKTRITHLGATTFVGLPQTQPHFGGRRRRWFVCPGVVGEYACRRRVRIIYSLWGTQPWGCRACLGLSYRSRRYHRLRLEQVFSGLKRLQRLQRDLRSRSPTCYLRARAALEPMFARVRRDVDRLQRSASRDGRGPVNG